MSETTLQEVPIGANLQPGRPIVGYLLGTTHCGSTLISFLAATHPRVSSVGEISPNRNVRRRGNVREFRCSCERRVAECPFWNAVFDKVAAAGQAFSSENWTNDYRYLNPALHRALDYYPVGALNRTLYAAGSGLLPFHARRTQRISAVNLAFIRAVLEIEGTDAFFDGMKGALRLQYLSQIDGLDVRVIRIVRDVRAFVRSKRKAGVKAADAAREWLYRQQSAEAVLRRFTPENVLTIRYEQLAQECNREMGRIFDHLGLEPFTIPEEIDPREFHIFGNSMRLRGPIRIRFSEQWRDELPREDLDTALRIAGECNVRLGYA